MSGVPAAPALPNAGVMPRGDVPAWPWEAFRDHVIGRTRSGARLAAVFGEPRGGERLRLHAVIADGREGRITWCSTDVADAYPALTPECPAAHWFEREIAEQWGVRPEGHPWPRPIRSDRARREGPAPPSETSATGFFRVEGEEVHEVAVGPVHAGVIEPGHFRFQCHGERVFHLEISLGFQHRGIERALEGGPDRRTAHLMETAAGDTSIGHALAYAQAVESLAGCRVPARAQALRAIALELERLANHVGDLGALAGDVGFLPTASYCGRVRGDVLNLTALMCGSRFGRGLVRPGGVGFDLDDARVEELARGLARALPDAAGAIELLWNTSSVRARFENAGPVSRGTCLALGLVGVAARACGVERDARQEFPHGMYQFAQIPISTSAAGNVFARAYVRWLEIQRSAAFIGEQLETLPGGPVRVQPGPLQRDAAVVSITEGWRGEICHVAHTGPDGRFVRYKIVDPSFHNWAGLAMALRNQHVSDFPLCNKSFNLSYCGHDL